MSDIRGELRKILIKKSSKNKLLNKRARMRKTIDEWVRRKLKTQNQFSFSVPRR